MHTYRAYWSAHERSLTSIIIVVVFIFLIELCTTVGLSLYLGCPRGERSTGGTVRALIQLVFLQETFDAANAH